MWWKGVDCLSARPTQDGTGREADCNLALCDEVLGACLPAAAVVVGRVGGECRARGGG